MRKLMESIGWSADDDEDISYYADDDPEHVDFDHQSPHDEDEFRPEDDRLGHNDPDRGNVEEGRDVRRDYDAALAAWVSALWSSAFLRCDLWRR